MAKSVAIIGAGFSGSLTALNLLRAAPPSSELQVVLIDPRGTFGPGLAYSVPSHRFKLNVRAHAMGAFPEDPEGFLRWLKERDPSASGDEFISRRLYGDYLQDLVADAARRHPESLRLVSAEVLRVNRLRAGGKLSLLLSNDEQLEADFCVLAIGNLLRRGVESLGTQGLLREPYSASSYAGIQEAKEVFILGSSLTAVDVILECEGLGFTGSYSVVSRNGRFPLPHEDPASLPNASLPAGWENPSTALSLLRTIRNASRSCGSSQPVFDAMRPKIQQMWQNLPNSQRRAFLRHLRPFWEVHRHRIPAEHLAVIKGLQQAGRLTIQAARITQVSSNEAVIAPKRRLRDSNTGRTKHVRFDVGFICAGPEGDITRIDHPLAHSLLAQGLVRPGALKLGVEPESPSSDSNFMVLGPMQKEQLWETTAVRELRQQAAQLAQRIVAANA